MKGSKFVLDSLDLLHYKLHKIDVDRSKSYLDSLKWLKKGFQDAITLVLNHIVKNLKKISEIRPFINKHNWKGIKFPSHRNDRKKSETNNKIKQLL